MEKDQREILKSPKKKKKSDLFSPSLSFDLEGKRDIRYPHRKISSAERERA